MCVVLVVWVGTWGGRAHQPPATRVNVTGFLYCILCYACHTSTYIHTYIHIHPPSAANHSPIVKQLRKTPQWRAPQALSGAHGTSGRCRGFHGAKSGWLVSVPRPSLSLLLPLLCLDTPSIQVLISTETRFGSSRTPCTRCAIGELQSIAGARTMATCKYHVGCPSPASAQPAPTDWLTDRLISLMDAMATTYALRPALDCRTAARRGATGAHQTSRSPSRCQMGSQTLGPRCPG